MRAWLVTWEWDGDARAVADKVVAVFNPRWSARRVAPLVECLYIHSTATVGQAAQFAKRPGKSRCRAKILEDSQITCGDHPRLLARKVDSLEVVEDPETLLETIYWTEPPRWIYSGERGRLIQRGEARRVRYRRRKRGQISNEPVWDRRTQTFKPGWEDYGGMVVEAASGADS